MATEYKLSYTASEIDEKLGKIDENTTNISKLSEEKVSNPSTGEVGQILEIETVDEKGKPKTYKAVNKPTGGEVSDEQIAEAVENYLNENPIEGGGGADGIGIQSVEQTTTSTEDGGTNIITVTKTDGTSSTFQVLNGSKGDKGDKGDTPVKGTDYFTEEDIRKLNIPTKTSQLENDLGYTKKSDLPTITQEAGESESLIMSQKAVTNLVNNALGKDETEYETVNSVDEMTDTTKQYVLSGTGTLWAYTEVSTEAPNRFDPSKATLNSRHGTSSTSARNGLFVTDYIAVDMTKADPYIMRAFISEGVGFAASIGNQRVHYFDSDKTLLGNKYLQDTKSINNTPVHYDSDNNAYWKIDERYEKGGQDSIVKITEFDISKVAYVRVTLALNDTETAITQDDIANVIITFDADTGTTKEWVDTGIIPENANQSYVDLLVKVNKNTSDIKYLESQVANLSSEMANLNAQSIQQTPLYANSIEECTDTSKVYVLPDGFIYAYMTKEEYIAAQELFDRNACTLNARYSGTPGSQVSRNGYYITDFIPIDMSLSDPIILRIKGGKMWTGTVDKLMLFDASKNCLATTVMSDVHHATVGGTEAHLMVADGDEYYTKLGYTFTDNTDLRKHSVYNQIAYIRINQCINSTGSALDIDNVPDVSITIDAMGGTNTTTAWHNTGHAFVPADYEERIVSLEDTVTNIQSGNGSDVSVPSFWKNAVDECIAKIKALQVGRNCVTFPFFSDNHQRNGHSGRLIRRVMDECHIPFCFYGGDSIDSGYIASEAVMISQDAAFDTMMKSAIPNGRFCRAVGNHDGFWNVSAETGDEHYYTREQVYELFLREESIAQNKHFGDDGTYYYVDDIASKTRFIVLNTNGGSVDSTQLSWLQNTALSFTESGWAVVFISHQPISNHYHANISNAEEVRTIVANYINGSSSNKADVVGWFSGHIHRDRIYTGIATNTTDDTVGTAMGFTQVTITSDHTGIAYDDTTKHTVADDNQSHAIDFITINKSTKTVNLTRLGIGEDRSYTYQ